jgi:hypothetical protein
MGSFQSMPQDAADRAERVGWLGDPGFVGEDYIYNFSTTSFWAKWVRDIKDSQKPDGCVPFVSPPHWGDHTYNVWPAWQSDRVYDGRNMLPMLRGEATEPLHEALFWDGAETHWGVRMGRWKLVHTRREAFELYDLGVDTSEANNLAEKHPEIVEQLKRKYLGWKSKMASQMKKRMESGRRNRQRDDRTRNRQQEN